MHAGVDSGAVLRGLLPLWAVLQEFHSQLASTLCQKLTKSYRAVELNVEELKYFIIIILKRTGTTSSTEDLTHHPCVLSQLAEVLLFKAIALFCDTQCVPDPTSTYPAALQLPRWVVLLPGAVLPQALWWRCSELTQRMDSGSNT